MPSEPMPVFFHEEQLLFKPVYEWAFGERIEHPETTARAESILGALEAEGSRFAIRPPAPITIPTIRRVHGHELITLYSTASELPEGETFYPSVFPKKRQAHGDPTRIEHAGSFCFDSGTPLSAEVERAAAWSAACSVSAAKLVAGGAPAAYALSRPPGHHASRELFGGYCYYNNAAIAANLLRRRGSVAIVDIDYHHGNGTQSLFYRDPRVLVVSVHGDPSVAYPFFAGYSNEQGQGRGLGLNVNVPLSRGTDGDVYLEALEQHVLPVVRAHAPSFLIVSAGFDTYELDTVGDFDLTTADIGRVGEALGSLGLPTVIVQEGGYYTPDLGLNARSFLEAFAARQARALAER